MCVYGACFCSDCVGVCVKFAVFCMTCSLLMLVKDAKGDNMEEACSRAGIMTAL